MASPGGLKFVSSVRAGGAKEPIAANSALKLEIARCTRIRRTAYRLFSEIRPPWPIADHRPESWDGEVAASRIEYSPIGPSRRVLVIDAPD